MLAVCPPALQFVADRHPNKTIVTLGYEPGEGSNCQAPAALDLPRGEVERRLVLRRDFDRIADKRNFYESLSDQRGDVDPALEPPHAPLRSLIAGGR